MVSYINYIFANESFRFIKIKNLEINSCIDLHTQLCFLYTNQQMIIKN